MEISIRIKKNIIASVILKRLSNDIKLDLPYFISLVVTPRAKEKGTVKFGIIGKYF